MKRDRLFIILFLSTILFFAGCGRDADDTADDDMTYEDRDEGLGDRDAIDDQTTMQGENEFWTSDRDYTFDQKNEFKDDVNAALTRLDNRINELEQIAANATDDTKMWYNDRIEELKSERAEIQQDLQNFNNVTADNWEDFKGDITSNWEEIEHSYSQMAQDDRMQEDRQF